jgi:DNA gyrase subunit B
VKDEKALKDWAKELTKRLNMGIPPTQKHTVSLLAKTKEMVHTLSVFGVEMESATLNPFFASKDFKSIQKYSKDVESLVNENSFVEKKTNTAKVEKFSQVVDFLIEDAKKGQSFQRYKGLGEMNPDQLWDTTMDPDNRTLLKVKIEDAIVADEVFSTLMGDEVEPRRNFIETNALLVENLDY